MSYPPVPTEEDWRSEPWCIDTPGAYKHFAHKTLEEAEELFKENALYHQEDLMWMPTSCFHFYINAYINYLLSDASKDDCDGASCFFGLIEFRHKGISTYGTVLSFRVLETLDRLAASQAWFDAEKSIYGDFQTRANKVRELLSWAENSS